MPHKNVLRKTMSDYILRYVCPYATITLKAGSADISCPCRAEERLPDFTFSADGTPYLMPVLRMCPSDVRRGAAGPICFTVEDVSK